MVARTKKGTAQDQLNFSPVVQNARSLDADNPQAKMPTNQASLGMRPKFATACSNTPLLLTIANLCRAATTPASAVVRNGWKADTLADSSPGKKE
jgi:hypothetical protein